MPDPREWPALGALTAASTQPGRLPDRATQPISDCIDLIATVLSSASWPSP